MRRSTIVLVLAAFAVAARAQAGPPVKQLPKDADPNDWVSYYEYAVKVFSESPDKAYDAFRWASRIDPTRAEPFQGMWSAFWMKHRDPFLDYLDGAKEVIERPDVIHNDSVLWHAFERNPFVNEALEMVIWKAISQFGYHSDFARGMVAYANQSYETSVTLLWSSLNEEPAHYWRLATIASVYAQMRKYDSTAIAMEMLIAKLREIDKSQLVYLYQSKEMAYYALGLTYAQLGRIPESREAQGHALEENIAFAPAHVALGQLAVSMRDTATARSEYSLAVELEPKDGAIRYWYGAALLRAQAPADAITQLKEAIRLEPYFADPWMTLGLAYATQHDTANAVAAYSEFLNRAPRRSTNIAIAQQRIAALKHSP